MGWAGVCSLAPYLMECPMSVIMSCDTLQYDCAWQIDNCRSLPQSGRMDPHRQRREEMLRSLPSHRGRRAADSTRSLLPPLPPRKESPRVLLHRNSCNSHRRHNSLNKCNRYRSSHNNRNAPLASRASSRRISSTACMQLRSSIQV